jgi:hypothetical protein
VLEAVKGSEVFPLSCGSVFLPGVQAKLTGFEFANHAESRCRFLETGSP